jgi:hypothetical protein
MNDPIFIGKLQRIIARLEMAGPGIVMVAPGYSRAELVADLRAVLAALGGVRQEAEPRAEDRGRP